jgi:hypothetical protein
MQTQPITDFSQYPSLITAAPSNRVSSRYTFIPTARIINVLADHGWQVSRIQEKRSRVDELRGFGEHIVRFRRQQDFAQLAVVGEHVPEIVLTGAHDGSAAWQMMFGLWRFVCGNGAVVAESEFASHRILHKGFQDQNVIDAVYEVVETAPRVLDRVRDWQAITLTGAEQIAFAEAAVVAKYGSDDSSKYSPAHLIHPTRRDDLIIGTDYAGGNTLWNTYNIVQEKLVEKGGRFAVNTGAHRRSNTKTARGIQSVGENVRVNQALWMLAEKMAALKS